MTTLVIGANGQIGRQLCALAREAAVPVRAMVRDPRQAEYFGPLDVPTVVGDLEGDFALTLEGCDQLVFAAGSGPHTGADKTLLIDLWGAIRAVDAAVEAGLSHFVMVSALRAANPLAGPEKLRPYLAAKRAADLYLERSPIRHTILRPGRLTDAPATGRVTTQVEGVSEVTTISRANVARCLLHAIRRVPAASCSIDLLDGDTPIDRAW